MCANKIHSWSQAKTTELEKIEGVCFDIDETFSTKGKITSQAYMALWKLRHAGFKLVPLTGRCAGWCDHIARFWPVDGVIGENGAFAFFMKEGARKRFDMLGDGASEAKKKLLLLTEKIKKEFPQARWSSDQSYREYDLSVDVFEDVKPWTNQDIVMLMDLCEREGAHVKLSSVHVNIWYGDFDKFSGFKTWLSTEGASLRLPSLEKWIFIGDSPNDEPLFKSFGSSVAVANIAPFLENIVHPPKWVTDHQSGSGFVEFAEKLVQVRHPSGI